MEFLAKAIQDESQIRGKIVRRHLRQQKKGPLSSQNKQNLRAVQTAKEKEFVKGQVKQMGKIAGLQARTDFEVKKARANLEGVKLVGKKQFIKQEKKAFRQQLRRELKEQQQKQAAQQVAQQVTQPTI